MEHVLINRSLLILFFSLYSIIGFSQSYYRVKADFSTKENSAEGKVALTMGEVYYDKNYEKLVFNINFPENTILASKDSMSYQYTNNKLINKESIAPSNRFTVFHLALNNKLSNFGLEDSPYKIEKVEKADDMVITTWTPPSQLKSIMGKTIVSQKDKKLHGVIFYNNKNEISTKFFYKNYTKVNGLDFPQEIIQITYKNGKELYKVTTFKNIKLNETSNDHMYNIVLH